MDTSQWVSENRRCLFEGYPVLFRVLACLLLVPFEANRHTDYRTTFNGNCRADRSPSGLTAEGERTQLASASEQANGPTQPIR